MLVLSTDVRILASELSLLRLPEDEYRYCPECGTSFDHIDMWNSRCHKCKQWYRFNWKSGKMVK